MEDILIEIAKQVPALLVLAWILYKFNKSNEMALDKFLEFIRAREEKTDLIESKVAMTIKENTRAFNQTTNVLKKVKMELSKGK